MRIDHHNITYSEPPKFVAEISCNHAGSLDNALALIELAKKAKADFVKFQCYEPAALTLPGIHTIEKGPWKGYDLYDLYEKAKTPYAWFYTLAEKCAQVGIPWFSSVFDLRGIDILERAGTSAYKIASGEITDLDLIRDVALTGKPLIISTGMASREDINRGLAAAQENSPHDVVLLHCVSAYPSRISEAQLKTIEVLKDKTQLVGLSDHTTSHVTAITATAMGVCMIEKHIRMELASYKDAPLDLGHSVNSMQFHEMVNFCTQAWISMHDTDLRIDHGVWGDEKDTVFARRSLYALADIKKGEQFTRANVGAIRPNKGLPPWRIDEVLKTTAPHDIKKGTALTGWEAFEETVNAS